MSNIVNIDGKTGSAILFDCDLLHAGRQNKCNDRNVIQYKICHKDDLSILGHLDKIDNAKDDECVINNYTSFMRKMSYFFEMPINYFAYMFMLRKEDENTVVGYIQHRWIPMNYYNNA